MESLMILRRVNDQLELDYNNLDKILEAINLSPDIPVAILSFIGEKGSGKTFYTNLLIQNLRNGGTGGWLSQVSYGKRGDLGKPLPGFPFIKEGCESSDFTATSAISLWAESFQLENHGKKFAVLVFHANYNRTDPRRETLDSLELFLALLSSRIVEIQWKKQEFRILDIIHHLLENEKIVFDSSLRNSSLVYLFRTHTKLSKGHIFVGKKAANHLKKLIKGTKYSDIEMEYPENINILNVEDRKESFVTTKGSLSLSTKMHNNLEAIINLIADDEEIFPKVISTTDEEVTGGKLKEFMQTLVHLVNNIVGGKKETVFGKIEMTDSNTDLPVKQSASQSGKTTFKSEAKVSCKLEKVDQIHQKKQLSQVEHINKDKTCEENLHELDKHAAADANRQLVEFVSKQVEENILIQLKNWKPDDGSPETNALPDLLVALEERLHVVLKPIFEKAHEMPESNRQLLIISCSTNLNNVRKELETIQDLLQSFHRLIEKIITNQGYILPEEFPNRLENLRALGKGILKHEESLEYTMRACNWLITTYKNENQLFFSSLETILDGLEQIRKFYIEETKRVLTNGPYTSKTILEIHTILLNECIFALITTAELPIDPESLMKFGNHQLSKQFSALKQANRKMLLVLQKRMNKLVAKAKEMYDQNDELNNILNSKKVSRTHIAAFQDAHEQARTKAAQFLEERISSGEIRAGEPVKGHRKTLLAVIDNYWNDLLPTYMN